MKKSSSTSSLAPCEDDSSARGPIPLAAESSVSTGIGNQERRLLAEAAADLSDSISEGNARRIPLSRLINRLNFINFQEGRIQLYFAQRGSDRVLLVPAAPMPCSGPELECVLSGEPDGACLRNEYDLKYILVPYGDKIIQSTPEVIEINTGCCRLALPSTSREIGQRRIERQRCQGIAVQLIQNGSTFSGSLLDFTASSFRAELNRDPSQAFDGIDAALPVQVIFHSGKQTLYSNECRIIRTTRERALRGYVLEPLKQVSQRYGKAEFRSERQILSPSPNIIFRHPLTQKRVDLKAVDISGSGFAVEEEESASVLMPGLILPEIELSFGSTFKLTCSVQVVFRKSLAGHEPRRRVRCGLALIDVAAQDHIKLLGILHQVKNKNTYVCNHVDLEALWDFLFESGFIYPAKYTLIEKNKKEIKETYAKLYTRSPDIARHFVYQENGVILGHMATIRYWENAWLIHHHAARKNALTRAGLVVLDQIGSFGHDSFRIRGMHMDYLVCYYRPENRFPSRIFGGVARHINNPKGCSLDLFAFVKPTGAVGTSQNLPAGWKLSPAEAADMDDLRQYYEKRSGGLMLKALDLEASSWKEEELCTEFQTNGFRRERHLFCLQANGSLKAVVLVNISDIGLNLSDLTHCLNAIVLDPADLPPEVLLTALRMAETSVGQSNLPALIFPMAYVEQNAIPFEKAYYLWVFHMHTQSQVYFKYLSRIKRH
jgi:hypothetical protein